ncbi:MAG: hypothetical protein MMC33_009452 [Icmadophila ericetorum]|nr:hypothetical protein [Icmadophila ericetorum]
MSIMEWLKTFHITHLPVDMPIHVAHFTNVTNAGFLRQQLLDGNTNFEYAFLDASSILSTTQLLAAVFRAVKDLKSNRIKSRNVHSEIVLALSPNNNIGESFRRFGLTEKTKDLLVVKVATSKDTTADHVVKHLSQSVEGTWAPFTDEALSQSADLAKIGKIYKLEPSSKGPPRGQEHVDYAREELEMIILGLMALRGAS